MGEINNNKRIWIANKNILNSFSIGESVAIDYKDNEKEIEINPANPLLTCNSISSRNGNTPIIDIKNSNVTQVFKGIEKVEVRYYEKKIVIRATKSEIDKNERNNKGYNTMFELFCGGGTMTSFLKITALKLKAVLISLISTCLCMNLIISRKNLQFLRILKMLIYLIIPKLTWCLPVFLVHTTAQAMLL